MNASGRIHGQLAVAASVLCLLAFGCSGEPVGSATAGSLPSAGATSPIGSQPPSSPAATEPRATTLEPGDPAAELTGLAVAGIGDGGADFVLRIGMEGFRIPDGEAIFDIHGERVLTARPGRDGSFARLLVRDLAGAVIREIDAGMHLPQTGIVRGDDVYFGGLDLGPEGDDIDAAVDRGAWVARGDSAPARIQEPSAADVAVYHEFDVSPDGDTVGIWRCGEICSTHLIGPDGRLVDIPKPGLIALTNEVALLIGAFSDVTAHSTEDGRELWRAATDGLYLGRYATSDGRRIVLSSIEPVEGGEPAAEQIRVEVVEAVTGEVVRTVVVPIDGPQRWVEPALSSDRYVAVLDTVIPSPDDGPDVVRVIDLETGELLGVELRLGDVPG